MATSDRGLDKQGEQIMSKFLSLSVAAFACAVFFGAHPAAAKTYEYCRKDVSSAMQQCGFETLAQCQAMASGRGGDSTAIRSCPTSGAAMPTRRLLPISNRQK
jgi:hypothetical protein